MPGTYDNAIHTLIVFILFEKQLIDSNAFVALGEQKHFHKEHATCGWNLVPCLLIAVFVDSYK